ncbi:sulfatase-like hydrolase/transferase [Rubinisphaera margarita]|uniref:sulfatase-like hydrolase/transferase n=1 Tax=Rubinisphaera margarita TaxID=2909586 RepID=UPI001EE81293|nr:sulfatase-like hydrolase/transferase [Rubinisphaera margarita]MCG6155931.1 sulfatase-like hydrolase/transferase [Rubinisphaera margarita]
MLHNPLLRRILAVAFVFTLNVAPSTSVHAEEGKTASKKADRPNIVFILADDVGREVLGCYGGVDYPTPNLDALADSGARFTHAYSMPVCHPSRTTLLTGCYPRTIGNPKWGSFPAELEGKTVAQALKQTGYRTAVAGKWQLCLLKKDPSHPQRLGFEQSSLFGWHEGARYYDPLIHENGSILENTDGMYGPDHYVDFLLDFMKDHREEPFFAFYSMALCHDVTDDIEEAVPYAPGRDRYDSFSEMAAQMDRKIGDLMTGMEKLGLRENTLVLFTTDNGTPFRTIARYEDGKYIREPVSSQYEGMDVPGGKGSLNDWGTRVPTIASWPGVIEPGQVWDDLVDFSDILPTFIELADAELPDGTLDGQSFASRLTENQPGPRQWAYAESRGNRYFAKSRTRKLYNNGRYYNTEKDPFEKTPLDVTSLQGPALEEYEMLRRTVEMLASETDTEEPASE